MWQKVYRDFGITDEEVGKFLVGPAYLPFGWMGCIDGWGGPLPQSWIDRHAELQKKIVARERELGMTPALHGFTGHVPEAIKRVFPQAKPQRLPSWCEFPGTYFLDPMDPLFQKFGKAFVEEQTRQFGTDHLYASDTFIEMSPPSNDLKFLAEAMGAYRAGDAKLLSESAARHLDLMRDMDDLLATRPESLLGKWLSDAKRWATNDAERTLCEWNARNLITLWGPRKQSP